MRLRPVLGAALALTLAGALAGCSGNSTGPDAGATSSDRPSVSASSGQSSSAPPSSPSPGTSGAISTSTASAGTATNPTPLWPSYHGDDARTGAVAGSVASPASTKWTADLGAAVYGQPVIVGNTVLVGTENDDVVALDRSSGRKLWSHRIGTPLTDVAARAGCGNIDPLGITSTLAVDPARNEVFAVGEVDESSAVQHRLVGLDVATGSTMLSEAVDPPLPSGERAIQLLQRPGLAVANGRVYIGYGGNIGDCGKYHGWLVGASETKTGDLTHFEVAKDGEGGAIWLSGGAPAIGSDGSVYVTTGNANPFPAGQDKYEYTESVVRLSPTLRVLASFKDPTAGGDEDLATGNPVLLPGGLVFAVGKTDTGYLLRTSDLGRVAAIRDVCGSNPDGGPAYDAATERLFVPCRGGAIQVIDIPHRRLGARLSGPNAAPVVVGGTVWAASYPGGGLTAFSTNSGKRLQTVRTSALPNFATPSYADGVLFLGTRRGVAAIG